MFDINDFNRITTKVLNVTSEFVKLVPKSETDLKNGFEKLKTVFETESENVNNIFKTYYNFGLGITSTEDVTNANIQFEELLKGVGLCTISLLPFGILSLPLIVAIAKDHNIELIPESMKQAFNLKL